MEVGCLPVIDKDRALLLGPFPTGNMLAGKALIVPGQTCKSLVCKGKQGFWCLKLTMGIQAPAEEFIIEANAKSAGMNGCGLGKGSKVATVNQLG